MSVVATAPLPHKLVDIRSAERRGPSTGGQRLTCPGLLEPDGGREHGFVSMVCDHCGNRIAIREAVLEGLVEPDPDDAKEPWWQR